MNLSKAQLKQIIKEELSKQLDEGPLDFIKGVFGGATPEKLFPQILNKVQSYAKIFEPEDRVKVEKTDWNLQNNAPSLSIGSGQTYLFIQYSTKTKTFSFVLTANGSDVKRENNIEPKNVMSEIEEGLKRFKWHVDNKPLSDQQLANKLMKYMMANNNDFPFKEDWFPSDDKKQKAIMILAMDNFKRSNSSNPAEQKAFNTIKSWIEGPQRDPMAGRLRNSDWDKFAAQSERERKDRYDQERGLGRYK